MLCNHVNKIWWAGLFVIQNSPHMPIYIYIYMYICIYIYNNGYQFENWNKVAIHKPIKTHAFHFLVTTWNGFTNSFGRRPLSSVEMVEVELHKWPASPYFSYSIALHSASFRHFLFKSSSVTWPNVSPLGCVQTWPSVQVIPASGWKDPLMWGIN